MTSTQNDHPTPEHLGDNAASWLRETCDRCDLIEEEIRLLPLAAESLDRNEQARQAIDEHGMTYEDRFGNPKTRPEVAIERDSKLAYARIIKQLGDKLKKPKLDPNAVSYLR